MEKPRREGPEIPAVKSFVIQQCLMLWVLSVRKQNQKNAGGKWRQAEGRRKRSLSEPGHTGCVCSER